MYWDITTSNIYYLTILEGFGLFSPLVCMSYCLNFYLIDIRAIIYCSRNKSLIIILFEINFLMYRVISEVLKKNVNWFSLLTQKGFEKQYFSRKTYYFYFFFIRHTIFEWIFSNNSAEYFKHFCRETIMK